MMLQEFEALTGIYPSAELYRSIEAAYTDFDGDKRAFCEAYKSNADSLAERIQQAANAAEYSARREANKTADDLRKVIAERDGTIDRLRRDLDRAEEWQPYEYRENAKQADYERLRSAGRVMTDEEARQLLADWFCFQPGKIEIRHIVAKIEKNRFGQCRQCGEYERPPVYEATDWNYIRFDCGLMTYELINGELSLFVH